MRGISKNLTKNLILELVSQADIFAFYLSKFNYISSEQIDELANSGRVISNPMRIDKHPSFGFKYNNKGKLRAKDFAGYFWGDCFDLVSSLIHVNTNNKQGFMIVLHKIVNDLQLNLTTNSNTPKLDTSKYSINVEEILKEVKVIEPILRQWNSDDLQYWSNSGIPVSRLNSEYVYPVSKVTMNNKVIYSYTKYNPCYAYYNNTVDGIAQWRLYYPKHVNGFPKFITNNVTIQGLLTYDKNADILIITKSLKDIMSIKEVLSIYYSRYKVTVIAPPSENIYFTDEQLRWLINNHKHTFTLFDFDKTGVNHSCNIKRRYPVNTLFFTNGKFNTYDYKAKDFSEYRSITSNKDIITLIDEIILEINKPIDERI